MRRAALLLAALAGLAAPAAARVEADWRRIVSAADRERLNGWRTTWTAAVAQARDGGFGGQVDAAGALLQPDAALGQPALPDGTYRCRTIRLGRQDPPVPGAPALLEAPAGRCRVANGLLARLDGPQRPGGRLFAYDTSRLVFVGGLLVGDEAGVGAYGRDPRRSLVGFVERIGPARWRLVLPEPAWEAKLEVVEIVGGE